MLILLYLSQLVSVVPRRSFLGPLIFLLCINERSQAVTHNDITLMDYDTSISFKHKHINLVNEKLYQYTHFVFGFLIKTINQL